PGGDSGPTQPTLIGSAALAVVPTNCDAAIAIAATTTRTLPVTCQERLTRMVGLLCAKRSTPNPLIDNPGTITLWVRAPQSGRRLARDPAQELWNLEQFTTFVRNREGRPPALLVIVPSLRIGRDPRVNFR